ncbi:MAG: site-2 protease family protein [Clostridia bacterium]|nr:site-2 protease family protein [Clostridia bacterium]
MVHIWSRQELLDMLFRLPIIFLIIAVHETAHGFVAYKMGDTTAKDMGRLTLNPMKHLDIMGAICMLIFGFGWAKPVPINPMNFKKRDKGMVLTALAGPMSNILMALVGVILWTVLKAYNVIPQTVMGGFVDRFLVVFVMLNTAFAVFNLLPVPPLDGSKIIEPLLPPKARIWLGRNERILSLVLVALLLFGALSPVLGILNQWMLNGIVALSDLLLRPFL